MMKGGFFFLLLAVLLTTTSQAAPTVAEWLWPIAGQEAGEGVIGQPGQRIGRERIKGGLFIAAPEGTPVVCPADAIVKNCLLNYRKSLHYSYAWAFDKPFDEAVADARTEKVGKTLDPRYICVEMAMTVDNRDIYIGGLRCDTAFASGTMLHRGDTIGTVAYAYHRLAQPCISFASSWYSQAYDPMTPFGLQSTFTQPHYWRTEEKRLLILGAVALVALLFWLVFHIIYKVKDRRRKAYFKALMDDMKIEPSDWQQDGQAFPSRLSACRQAFEATSSARVLAEAAADDGRLLTADERAAILADVSHIFADIMIDAKKSSTKVNGQELLLCMLSVIHVPTAVMADCLNVGESTIRTRKTRLKNKMPGELFDLFFGKSA